MTGEAMWDGETGKVKFLLLMNVEWTRGKNSHPKRERERENESEEIVSC